MPVGSLPVVALVTVMSLAHACANPEAARNQWRERDLRAKVDLEPRIEPTGQAFVLVNATVMPVAQPSYSPGWVAVSGGVVTALGAGEPPPELLAKSRVVDARGRYVTPGLIDAHSHLGVYPAPHANAHEDGNEMTEPVTPGVWAEHAFWPQDPGIERAVAGGVTTLLALPGSGNLLGGRGVTLRLRPSRGARAMRFPGAPDNLKMACGENPKRVYGDKGQAPMTRMGNVRWQREAFGEAKESQETHDLDAETLRGVLSGDILVQVHCYRADDMLHMLEVAREYGFKVRSFHHAVEAYKIRDILASEGVSISTWADWWGFKLEAFDAIEENAALLHAAGVRAVIHSDSSRGIQRLNQEAAKAYYAGKAAGLDIPEEAALAWITLHPAWTLGIDAEVGTLEPGKRADIAVWSGHPLSVYSRAEWVFIDGDLVYDIQQPREPWSDFEVGLDAGGVP